MITNSTAPRSSVLNAMVESPLRALDALWSDVLYWTLDKVDQRNYSFRDSSGFLDLHIDGTVTSPTVSVTSITRASTTATVTCATEHGLSTGNATVIAGAVETGYNGTHVVTVTSTTVFTYTVSNSLATPATGTITSKKVGGGTPAKIATGSLQSAGPGLLTDYDHALNLAGKSWTVRFWVKFGTDQSASLPIVAIPGVLNFACGNNFLRPITSITRSGAVATVTTLTNHRLVDTESVVIGTAAETEYNGTFTITTTSPTTFTYAVGGTPATPATGTIKWKKVNATSDPGGDLELRSWIRSHDGISFYFVEPASFVPRGTWLRIIIRHDFVAEKFSIQQQNEAPLELTLPIDFDTYDRFNRFICGGADLTHDWILDEVGLWIDYVWTLDEATTDWNSGAGKTWPDVPNV